jgi:hypothetical protein
MSISSLSRVQIFVSYNDRQTIYYYSLVNGSFYDSSSYVQVIQRQSLASATFVP